MARTTAVTGTMRPRARFRGRALFQFHLSTGIVLMFVAGFLLWANLTPKHLAEEYKDEQHLLRISADHYGFPWTCWGSKVKSESTDLVPNARKAWICGNVYFGFEAPQNPYPPLAYNIIFALSILAGSAVLCEWLLLRRAAPLLNTSENNPTAA